MTPRLVATLKRYDVPATFFMVGSRVRTAPAAARLVARSGFTIGNHTWDHADLTRLSDGAIRQELRSTASQLRRLHIKPSNLMRPPYGAVNPRVLSVVRSMHLHPILWTVDPRDWESGDSAQIGARILGALRPHGDNVVLQHDGVGNSPNSVAAVPQIIRTARSRGYCFASVGADGTPTVPVPVGRVKVTPGAEHPHGKSTPVIVRIFLDRPTSRPVSVLLQTASGTATSGVDFEAVRKRIRFTAGVTSAVVKVPVRDDPAHEPVERLQVIFSQPRGIVMHRDVFWPKIISDDAPEPPLLTSSLVTRATGVRLWSA